MADINHDIMQCFVPTEKQRPNNRRSLKAFEIIVTSSFKDILERNNLKKLSSRRHQTDK